MPSSIRELVIVPDPKKKESEMNLILRKWALSAAVATIAAVVVLGGCSSNESQSNAPVASSQETPQTAAPGGDAGDAMPSEMATPAGEVGEIWTQIAEEQGKLSAAIQNGQLKDVHHLAFGIRDLVFALADKANSAAPANAAKLNGMVEQVGVSATKLDELGDAGNLSGTQAEYANLVTILSGIKGLTSGN